MGVTRTILQPGKGRTPFKGELVKAHYIGKLSADQTVFDSSRDRNKPLAFMIGIGSVIQGWDEGILEMQLGEIALLKVSADYGYGPEGMPPVIPPNADLEFEVELLSAGDDEASSSGCHIS
jgi:FK506-binding protein 1